MKTAFRILLTFTVLVFFSGMTFAQVASTTAPAKTSAKQVTAAPGKFVDANKNGICDNHEAKGPNTQGKNFVDKNGDGKCDNCGGTGKCKEAGKCGAKGQVCESSCTKGQGKGSCCGQGTRHMNGCATKCGKTTDTQPKK